MDGVFITSDALAASIVCSPKVMEAGILKRIPFISYDGLDISALLGISTVAQPIYEMGVRAAEQLIKEAEGMGTPADIVLPVRIVERRSTKKYKK